MSEGQFMKTCSFFGHRNVEGTPKLCNELRRTVIRLIEEEDVQVFLFGSASRFDTLCLKIVTQIQKKYPQIKRIYYRSQYEHIEDWYMVCILRDYDDTVLPKGVENAGRAAYVERNQAMINVSDFCIFYYNEAYQPPLRKKFRRAVLPYQPNSGTKIAYDYAISKKKEIINLYDSVSTVQ